MEAPEKFSDAKLEQVYRTWAAKKGQAATTRNVIPEVPRVSQDFIVPEAIKVISLSTGPRTPEGKARSSLNAYSHGFLTDVIPLHERDAYAEHRSAMRENYAPTGYLEEILVERISSSFWRLRRLERHESAGVLYDSNIAGTAFLARIDQTKTPNAIKEKIKMFTPAVQIHEAGSDAFKLESGPRLMVWLRAFQEIVSSSDHNFMLQDSEWLKAEKQLERALKRRGWEGDYWADASDTFLTVPLALRAAEALMRAHAVGPVEPVLAAWAWYGKKLRVFSEKLEDDLWRSSTLETIGQAQGSLPVEVQKIARYESHLERGLYRAMHELEAMQDKRKGRAAPLARVQVHGLPET